MNFKIALLPLLPLIFTLFLPPEEFKCLATMAYNDKGDMLPFNDDPMIRRSVARASVLILFVLASAKYVLAHPKLLNTSQ